MSHDVILKGSVIKIIYYNPTSMWGVLSILPDNSSDINDSKVASGVFQNVYEKCFIEVRGELKTHPKYGEQIEINNYKILQNNNTKEAVVNFLAKSSIKGISIANAVKIYNVHGNKSIDKVLNNPEDLTNIKGIGDKTIDRIKESISTYKDMQELVEYCAELGFSYNVISKIYKEVGKESLALLKENIYSILDHCDNISFKQLDSIALKNGTLPSDLNRLKYGFMYILKTHTTYEGSTGCDFKKLKEEVIKELGIENANFFNATLNILKDDSKVYMEKNKIYYKYYYDLERTIANYLLNIIARSNKGFKVNSDLIKEEIKSFKFPLNRSQVSAIINTLRDDIGLIVGHAGTGKSTILRCLVNICARSSYNIVLLAPTGKATRRIEECVCRSAKTVHRYINELQNSNSIIPQNTVIFIDESSMLDIIIFEKLLSKFNTDTKIVLIGDIKQLPSVGAGTVLQDIMLCENIAVHELTDVMRQAVDSNIIYNCDKVNKGELLIESVNLDFYYKTFSSSEALLKTFINLYDREIKKLIDKRDINNIQVITPYRKDLIGTNNLNKNISNIYNKNEIDEKFGFKICDKVMQITNNYKKDVFNGETGIIKSIIDDYLTVDFNGKEVTYEPDEADELMLAYVSTIHKCVVGDTILNTNEGLVTIEDLWNTSEPIENRNKFRINKKIRILTKDGVSNIKEIYKGDVEPIINLKTHTGLTLSMSKRHPIYVYDSVNFKFNWVKSTDLKVGDLIPINQCLSIFPEEELNTTEYRHEVTKNNYKNIKHDCKIPSSLNKDIAYLMGILVGDGSYNCTRDGDIRIHNSSSFIINRFKDIIKEQFGLSNINLNKSTINRGAQTYYVINRNLRDFLAYLDLKHLSCRDKEVPKTILRSPKDVQANFLRGLFDTDGSASGNGSRVMLATSSMKIAKVVQLMLLNFNIRSYIINSSYEGNYRLEMYGKNTFKFQEEIGFSIVSKIKQLEDKCAKVVKSNFKVQDEIIPNGIEIIKKLKAELLEFYGASKRLPDGLFKSTSKIIRTLLCVGTNLNYKHINIILKELEPIKDNINTYKILELLYKHNYFFDTITELTYGNNQTYDLEIPKVHNFISNGLISHNCQGSEYPVVFVLIDDTNPMLLFRKVLYTAISRAKNKVYLLSTGSGVNKCILNLYETQRITKLGTFLTQ